MQISEAEMQISEAEMQISVAEMQISVAEMQISARAATRSRQRSRPTALATAEGFLI